AGLVRPSDNRQTSPCARTRYFVLPMISVSAELAWHSRCSRDGACQRRRVQSFFAGRYVGTDLLSLGELRCAGRNSSQVRLPTARSGLRVAPARLAPAAVPG